jgi:hypothetical protein
MVSKMPRGSDEDAGHGFPRSKATWSDWSRLNLDVCHVDAKWGTSRLITSLEAMMADGVGYSANLTVLLMGFGGGVFTIGCSSHSLMMGDGFIARWASSPRCRRCQCSRYAVEILSIGNAKGERY